MPGKVTLGIDTVGGNLSVFNCAALTVGYNISDAMAAKLGLNYSNDKTLGGVETSQTGLSARFSYTLPIMWGAASPVVGLQYSTDGASTATSIMSLTAGVQAEVAKGVMLGVGLIPYSTASMSGNTDTSMNTGTGNTMGRSVYIAADVALN
ncbi:hypothetical protein ACFL1W_01105 [Candidatus Margulisiibacteriota bacterium]